jgi:4-aminobutyrate aminotransferase/(S)-3-amino-2-methylpropionate transaminase
MPYKDGFGPFTPEVYRMPMAYPYRCDSCSGSCKSSVLDTVIHKIEKEIGANNVACIVIEPIMGEGGFIVPCKGFLPGLVKFCKDNGILFVADEVQTGFARTGQMFGGSPIACAAALGAIATIEEEKLVDRANHIGKIISDALNEMKKKYPIVGDVRGRGAMQAIELVIPGSKEPNPTALTSAIKYCQQKGVLILSAGTYSNVIRLLPPLVMPDHLLKEALTILDEALAQA